MKTILKCFMWSCSFLLVQTVVAAFSGAVLAIKYGVNMEMIMKHVMTFTFISGIIFIGIIALSKRNAEMGLFKTCRFKMIELKEIAFAVITGLHRYWTVKSSTCLRS